MMQKYFFSLLLFLLSLSSNAQTCIMLIAKADTIFVGADSRSSIFLPNRQTHKMDTIRQTICKIHNTNTIHFAVAGYPDRIITNFLLNNNSRTGDDLLNSLRAYLTPMLEQELEKIRMTENQYFTSRFIGNDICSVVFFGFGKYGAYSSTIYFDVKSDKDHSVKVRDTVVNRRVEILGVRDHLNKLSIEERKIQYSKEPLAAIEWSINYERKFHPNEIGLPIDLMYLTRNGVHWVRKQQICN